MSYPARIIFISVYILIALGIVMTYSASAVYAERVYSDPNHFLIRQLIYAIAGTLLLFLTASVPVGFWKRHARAVILIAIFFLVLVYLPGIGHSAGGAQRWIGLGIINFQPAELAKVAVSIYLADYLSRKKHAIQKGSLTVFFPALILIGSICTLTLLQPDLGSTAFLFLLVVTLFFLGGIRLRYIAGAVAVIAPIFYFLVAFVPYRAERITAYLNPWEDPQGSGFQIIQSFLAFGLGGLKGVGLGQGMQKLFYLPSSYNDFIFSIIGEELGLIGILLVLALYAVIFISGIQLVENADQDYEKFLVIALILSIVLQAVIHILVTTGLIPTKGLPLPFVSFGGTALIFNMASVGLLMAVDKQIQGQR